MNNDALDVIEAKLLQQLDTFDAPPDFHETVKRLVEVRRLRDEQSRSYRPSPDTLTIVLGNLAGILLIMMYEQRHVFSPTALREVIRPKI